MPAPLHLDGLVAAVHTPFAPDGSLNLDRVPDQAKHLEREGLVGAFVAGTTGEFASLTLEEREALATRWCEANRERPARTFVHVGATCQDDAARLAAHAEAAGADAISALAPYYFRPAGLDGLLDFFEPIAAAAPNLPFYIYDIPVFTGVHVDALELLQRSAKRMPSFAGIKYTNADLTGLQLCLHASQGELELLYGNDESFLAARALGVKGAVGSTYNFAAALHHRVQAAYAGGEIDEARAAQTRCAELVMLLAGFGYPAACKALLRFQGLDLGTVRSPLPTLTADREEELRTALAAAGFTDSELLVRA